MSLEDQVGGGYMLNADRPVVGVAELSPVAAQLIVQSAPRPDLDAFQKALETLSVPKQETI